jgi:FtsH-binding integral membrane protein
MKFASFLNLPVNGYKTYFSVFLAVASGIVMILTKYYQGGIAEIFQVITLVFGGASIVGLRHAVAKLENPSKVP